MLGNKNNNKETDDQSLILKFSLMNFVNVELFVRWETDLLNNIH